MDFIFLVGPPGSGKTVCGIELSRQLECRFFDTDTIIEEQERCKIADIFAKHGEDHFRRIEQTLVESLASEASKPGKAVFATGGGLPIFNGNMEKLQSIGTVIALNAQLPVLVDRVRHNQARPLLASDNQDTDDILHQRLSELIEKRSAVYDLARYKIDTTGLKPSEVAQEIIKVILANQPN